MLRQLTMLAVGLVMGSAAAGEGDLTTATHQFTRMADGVYFVTGTGAVFLQSNALVIVTDVDVIVVDSHVTPAGARGLLDGIARLTDKPVTTLINSHFHFDHVHGNQAFGPGVTIIGHEFTRARMLRGALEEPTFKRSVAGFEQALAQTRAQLAAARDDDERARLTEQEAFISAHVEATREIEPVAPDVTLMWRMALHRGGREIELHYLGRGHTAGDIVVLLPEERLLFTGDLLLGGPSWMGDGYVQEWSNTLERLEFLEFDLVLPGHGAPFSDRDRIDRIQDYYDDLWFAAFNLHNQGVAAEKAAAELDLTGYADLGITEVGVDPVAMKRIYDLLEDNDRHDILDAD